MYLDLAIVDILTGETVCTVVPDEQDTKESMLQAAKEFCRAHCAYECNVLDLSGNVVWKHR